MKHLALVLLILCASTVLAQSYVDKVGHPYSRVYYGAATFKADSHYVWDKTDRWLKVTFSLDSTAGTATAWFCSEDDSLDAVAIRPGTGGAYGDGRTHLYKRLRWYRVKGAVPLQVTIE